MSGRDLIKSESWAKPESALNPPSRPEEGGLKEHASGSRGREKRIVEWEKVMT